MKKFEISSALESPKKVIEIEIYGQLTAHILEFVKFQNKISEFFALVILFLTPLNFFNIRQLETKDHHIDIYSIYIINKLIHFHDKTRQSKTEKKKKNPIIFCLK